MVPGPPCSCRRYCTRSPPRQTRPGKSLYFFALYFFFHPRSSNAIFHSSHLGTRTYSKSSNSSGDPLTLIHLEMAGHSSAWRHAVAFGSDWQFNPQSRISNVPFTFIPMPASVASPPFPNPESSLFGARPMQALSQLGIGVGAMVAIALPPFRCLSIVTYPSGMYP